MHFKPLGLYIFAFAGFAFWVCMLGLYLVSPESDRFTQGHQEFMAVTGCWRRIRDGKATGLNACTDYAQFHMSFFPHLIGNSPASTTCNLSQAHLDYAERVSPKATRFLNHLAETASEDCDFPT